MKTFIALVTIVCMQGSLHEKPKPAPKTEKECVDACNKEFAKPYRECVDSPACKLYVTNEAKRCILKCVEQSE